MPPREEIISQLVLQWLSKADEDLEVAEYLLESGTSFFGAVAFHAQQAAEKYLKAMLVSAQKEFRKTHDIALLLDLVTEVDAGIAEVLSNLTVLSPFGVEVRYPGDVPDTSAAEAEQAVALARKCETTVREFLAS